ncbi:uncharacterized protein LOC125263964 [Megalobrama amblycephala]|uniref:uncharacterized protein LOC125263964 n=1 Tax=Megalobrama amblycephala TaxID=75352 RepID=UPI002013E298|nr:uncharacterized protein LOC125263964 [Megalobrama amblycephala]
MEEDISLFLLSLLVLPSSKSPVSPLVPPRSNRQFLCPVSAVSLKSLDSSSDSTLESTLETGRPADLPRVFQSPAPPQHKDPLAPPPAAEPFTPPRLIDQSAPLSLDSTWDHRPCSSTGLPRPSSCALVRHHSACATDVRHPSAVLHPSTPLALSGYALVLSPTDSASVHWYPCSTSDARRCGCTSVSRAIGVVWSHQLSVFTWPSPHHGSFSLNSGVGHHPCLATPAPCSYLSPPTFISSVISPGYLPFTCSATSCRALTFPPQLEFYSVFLCYNIFPGNRAVGGAATQSSTFAGWFAEKAIDSNRGLQQLNTSCSSTLNENNPWWRLDLRDVYRVREVILTNRNDNFAEQINGAEIRIGNLLENNGSNNPICAVIPAIPAGESYNYSCNGMEGRYVIVYVPEDQKVLTLCEVEVYGYLAENLAADGAATQSSTSWDRFAEKAIDRGLQQLYTGCSSTLNENNPWWRLDLRHIYRVSKVVITNRKDCCAERINGAEIRIGNSLENNGSNNPICAVIPAIPAGESYNYSCNGMEGRYVNLVIPGDMKTLTLCEVKVYGEGKSVILVYNIRY